MDRDELIKLVKEQILESIKDRVNETGVSEDRRVGGIANNRRDYKNMTPKPPEGGSERREHPKRPTLSRRKGNRRDPGDGRREDDSIYVPGRNRGRRKNEVSDPLPTDDRDAELPGGRRKVDLPLDFTSSKNRRRGPNWVGNMSGRRRNDGWDSRDNAPRGRRKSDTPKTHPNPPRIKDEDFTPRDHDYFDGGTGGRRSGSRRWRDEGPPPGQPERRSDTSDDNFSLGGRRLYAPPRREMDREQRKHQDKARNAHLWGNREKNASSDKPARKGYVRPNPPKHNEGFVTKGPLDLNKFKVDDGPSKKKPSKINKDRKKLPERQLTKGEESEQERFINALKKRAPDLQKKYGAKWQDVMWAIATKKAKESPDA